MKDLADKLRRYSEIKLKKTSVRVPKLKLKKEKIAKRKIDDKIPISSIINILIKNAVEKAKKEPEKPQIENKKYKILEDSGPTENGGYGTIQKNYGISPNSSYVDYEKLFSYLGKFRAKSPYENSDSTANSGNSREDSAFSLIGLETIEKGSRYVKYLFPKGADFHATLTSLVPVAGMNSAEWEQFKLWVKIDPVMYALKTTTS